VNLASLASDTVEALVRLAPRRTGSAGNQAATSYLADALAALGFEVDVAPFPVTDFRAGPSHVRARGRHFELNAAPYSRPVRILARPVPVSTLAELETTEILDAILFLHGEICREQIMPRNFPFYNPDNHRQLVASLESMRPAAVVAATGRSPDVGALYPYPLFVDGDFDVPNAFCTDLIGRELAGLPGPWELVIDAERIPSQACNVVARINSGAPRKVIITAHIDAYADSPGATDNASGVAALRLIATLLTRYDGDRCVEIVAMNGEDHYSAAGEIDYLTRHGSEPDRTVVVVNIDAIGYFDGDSAWSTYGCSPKLLTLIRGVFDSHPGLVEGDQWYSGDHMVFVQRSEPAVALTSEKTPFLVENVAHTDRDISDLIDPVKIVQVAEAVSDLIREL